MRRSVSSRPIPSLLCSSFGEFCGGLRFDGFPDFVAGNLGSIREPLTLDVHQDGLGALLDATQAGPYSGPMQKKCIGAAWNPLESTHLAAGLRQPASWLSSSLGVLNALRPRVLSGPGVHFEVSVDPHSLTYTELPDNLRDAMLAGAISLAEAAEIWDLALMTPDDEDGDLPESLWPAAERLHLFEQQIQTRKQ